MQPNVPPGARAAARVLLLSDRNRLLLLQGQEPYGVHRWWVAPGGGLAPGETFQAAAQRELKEETGLQIPIGPWVWTRRHVYVWESRQHDQYERYFVARAPECAIAPIDPDSYVVGHRWWDLDELTQSSEDFAPRLLPSLLPALMRGEYPDPAIDCGV